MESLWDAKPSLRHLLIDGLGKAIKVLERGSQFMAPSFPGMTGTDDCRLLEVPPLAENGGSENESEAIERWPEQGLLATRWPVLIFLLGGECDMRFGVTSEVQRHVPALPPDIGQYVVTARRGQFLLIPSHFPRPDGSGVHWERPEEAVAASTLMWCVFFPTGCFIHFCKTEAHAHTQTKSVYLSVPGTYRLIQDVESEVLGAQVQWEIATRNYLEVLFILLQRHLSGAQFELGPSRSMLKEGDTSGSSHRPPHLSLQQACIYIEDHLQESLRVPRIAAAIGISTSSLNQLFRRYLRTSTVQYIIDRRIERASTLLSETNLAVRLIAEQSGFPSLEHFSRTFHRATNVSPLAYRRRFQKHD